MWRNIFQNSCANTLRPRQNGRHFPSDMFNCIFLNENVWISLKMSLKFVPEVRINNVAAFVQIMAWRPPVYWRIYASLGVKLVIYVSIICMEVKLFNEFFYIFSIISVSHSIYCMTVTYHIHSLVAAIYNSSTRHILLLLFFHNPMALPFIYTCKLCTRMI